MVGAGGSAREHRFVVLFAEVGVLLDENIYWRNSDRV